jgi:non-specific protein-tyrosine kinase
MLKGRLVLREVDERLGLGLDDAGLARLSDAVSVEPMRDTQLIRLKVRHSDPDTAASIANTIPEVFIEQNERLLSARYSGSKESLEREMAALQADIGGSQAAIEAERARRNPDVSEVARLEALLAQYRSTYAGLLQSYEEIRVAEAMGGGSLAVTEPAELPRRPVLPRTGTNTVLAGLIGAIVASGAAFAIEYLDDTIESSEDVERATHLPAFAAISRFSRQQSAASGPLVAAEPRSAIAEAYRVLRTNLRFSAAPEEGAGTIVLVTSARPMEGKTTTAVNLAASLAQSRKRVLLVDADLRRPGLHTCLDLSNRRGLTSLLVEKGREPVDVVRKTRVSGLQVITAGRLPVNPAEVLGFAETTALFAQLRAVADYVIVDSPPALSVTDALILAQNVDGVLLVVEAGKTRRSALTSLVAALESVKAPILGVVLNRVTTSQSVYYHDGRYAHAQPAEHKAWRRRVKLASVQPAIARLMSLGRRLQRVKKGTGQRGVCAASKKPGV